MKSRRFLKIKRETFFLLSINWFSSSVHPIITNSIIFLIWCLPFPPKKTVIWEQVHRLFVISWTKVTNIIWGKCELAALLSTFGPWIYGELRLATRGYAQDLTAGCSHFLSIIYTQQSFHHPIRMGNKKSWVGWSPAAKDQNCNSGPRECRQNVYCQTVVESKGACLSRGDIIVTYLNSFLLFGPPRSQRPLKLHTSEELKFHGLQQRGCWGEHWVRPHLVASRGNTKGAEYDRFT